MPNYFYECLDCKAKLERELGRTAFAADEYEELVLFETAHSYTPTAAELAEALVCPRCDSTNAVKTYYGYKVLSYIRGNGYLDRAGCHRDMNLHQLTGTDDKGQPLDPYDHMRQPGEVEDLKVRLKRAGQHDPKTTYFPVAESAVRQALSTPESPATT